MSKRAHLTAAFLSAVLSFASPPIEALDCNRNGTEDQIDVDTASSDDCNGNGVPDECEFAPLTFGFGKSFDVDRIPRVAVAADFNGDGVPDLATGNQDSDTRSTVSVLLSLGDQTFDTTTNFAAGERLYSIASADLDQDGDVDIAAATFTALLLLKNRGDGTFEDASKIGTSVETHRSISTGDVNGDDIPDLLTTLREIDTVEVHRNRGDGTFGEPVSFAVGSQPSAIVSADLNGDGRSDLAVSNRHSDTVSLLIADANGAFADATHIDAGVRLPLAVVAEDLNADGDLDLAVAGPDDVAIRFNIGGGSFGDAQLFSAPATFLAAGDFDADGDPDLAYANVISKTVTLLVNDGGGRFGTTNFGLTGVRSAVATADFDGNGGLDVAVSVINPDRMALLWSGDIGASATVNSSSPLTFQDPLEFPSGGEPHGVDTADVDGDGNIDVIIANNQGGIGVLISNGDGSLREPTRYVAGGSSFSIAAADYDGDGAIDLASVGEGGTDLWTLKNEGDGTFARPVRYVVAGNTNHVIEGDLDSDGTLDLVVSTTDRDLNLFYNLGDGTFESQLARRGVRAFVTAPADVDGDGDVDLALAPRSGSALSILYNEGDRNFSDPVLYPAAGAITYVVAGDIDLDGHVDLAAAVQNRNVSVFWNIGDGSFSPGAHPTVDHNAFSLVIADVSGDDRPDLVVAHPESHHVSALVAQGPRLFAQPENFAVGQQPRWVVSGDFNNDAVMDVVSANHDSHGVTVLLNTTQPSANDLLEQICTDRGFHHVSIAATRDPAQRATKFVVPARPDPELVVPTVFQDVKRFPFHEEFLRETYADAFGDMTAEEYNLLVGRRETRDYYVGVLTRWPLREPLEIGYRYSFTVVADTGFHPSETLKLGEIQWVYAALSEAFQLAPLLYDPDTDLARREVEENWPDPPPVPIDRGDFRPVFAYEAYSLGTGFGRIRLLTLEEFEEENRAGRFTFQDIPVVGDAPRDIEGVVGGFVTARAQGDLSHTSIRLARSGTPNAFVANALDVFAPYDGDLVRIEVCESGYTIDDTVTQAQAGKFWSANRPMLSVRPTADRSYSDFDEFLEMDLDGAKGAPAEARYGGKATNLARLQHLLVGDFSQYRESGFAIPMRYYFEFMESNSVDVDGRTLTYTEYLREIVASPEFLTDSGARSETLEDFRRRARNEGVVDTELVERLTQRIAQVFGSHERMVRFRSSSNIEDALEFNGAGLYDSTSACAADTLDPEMLAGSHCDATRTNERTIERALKRVWASLWTFRAFEERSFFQIPQDLAAMGILVNRAFLDEFTNGVAFTGNPADPGDPRYVITAQVGEESVVSPEPGITAERNLLTIVDGAVVGIVRDRSSSLVPPGETVLSDEQLRELGAFMAHVDRNLPLELGDHARTEVLLDFEFKFEPDGSLAVKQVRPFLLSETATQSPIFELEVPPGTTVCGVFPTETPGRGPRVEYDTKSVVSFLAGSLELPTRNDSFDGELFEEVHFGAGQERAEPTGLGRFQVTRLSGDCNKTSYRFDFRQSFSLSDDRRLVIELSALEFTAQRDTPLERLLLDDEYLTFSLSMVGQIDSQQAVVFSSCSYEKLPLWDVRARLDDGSIQLFERFLPSEANLSTGPAAVVQAELTIEGTTRSVADYWNLVYSSRRHNRNVRYWIVLDPPLDLPSVAAPIHVVQLSAPRSDEPRPAATVAYLGERFEVLAEPTVRGFRRSELGGGHFRRGDADANGTVNLTDAVVVVHGLFQRDSTLPCQKSADANDDGRLTVSDAVRILNHLFRNSGALLAAPMDCGVDPTPDELTCESFLSCP